MIVKQYIKDFEKLGFGMFVHFGLYSVAEKGEWNYYINRADKAEYLSLKDKFNPEGKWAEKLVSSAKKAGCKYITLTTRHHEGFSLYDTCGLNDYDAPHSCGRDLVKEFTEECRKQNIIPFFYHTLLDWMNEDYKNDFPKYIDYLIESVEILCKNYGKIGGLWFDGMWDKPEENWQEDRLYGTIRKYQPEAMIINNTGLRARGALGNIELDSVTFERGRPQPINLSDSPKYIASEMCQTFAEHWGYAKNDFHYKSLDSIIDDLCVCRRYGSNLLLNVGPMGNGLLRPLDKAMIETLGDYVKINDEALRLPRPTEIKIEGNEKDFILNYGNNYYLFCYDLSVNFNQNVGISKSAETNFTFKFDKKIKSVQWLDNGEKLGFGQKDGETVIFGTLFQYGTDLVVRIAKIITE